jgi:signal transduction histidine kinase
VFRNILRNFAAYTPDGSVLSIEYQMTRESASPEYAAPDHATSGHATSGHATSGHAILRFSDNGPGVPWRELPTLFDTFYRGTNSAGRQGCGLGLSISRGIVEAHGGSICASSAVGGGLVLEMDLPLEAAPESCGR